MITISKILFADMEREGIKAYPYECCGALMGHTTDGARHCVELRPLDNTSQENKRRRFSVTADDYAGLERYATESHLSLLGFYHSHPDHPAQPSQTDLTYAWPFFSYIIIEINEKTPGATHSFVLDTTTDKFSQEELTIIDPYKE